MNSKIIWGFLVCWLAYGCGEAGVSSSELASRSTPSDGGTASACESDLDCAAGEECEFEHGGSFCKPHGGDDHDDGHGDDGYGDSHDDYGHDDRSGSNSGKG